MKILFVCTGNTCRSPMAEKIFNQMLKNCGKQNVFCHSAGLSTCDGMPASANSIAVCKEIGIDLSQHQSHQIAKEDLEATDLFAVMTHQHAFYLKRMNVPSEKIYVLGEQIADPYGGDITVYRRCREQISLALQKLLSQLKKQNWGE